MSKVWLITGSARGLLDIPEAALAAGNSVVPTARDTGRLADLAAMSVSFADFLAGY